MTNVSMTRVDVIRQLVAAEFTDGTCFFAATTATTVDNEYSRVTTRLEKKLELRSRKVGNFVQSREWLA